MTTKDHHDDEKDRAPRRDDAPAPETRPAPPVVEYPKMLYRDGEQLTVTSAEQEAAAKKDGFREQPGAPAADAPRAKREP